MRYRSKPNPRKDKKTFSRTADRSKGANYLAPMRGGIRL